MSELSPTTMDKVLRNSGASRVSKKAANEFGVTIEKIALEISEDAVKLSKHAGRKTVTSIDIRLAKKKV